MTQTSPERSAPLDATGRGNDSGTAATRAGRRLAEVEALSAIGSWEWDIRTNELHWSEQLCRVYGVEPDPRPITYEDFVARVHPDDRAEVEATVREAFQTGGAFTTEHRTIYPDGSVHLIFGRGYVLTDDAGRPVRMLGSGQDVTTDRAAAAERSAEERRRAADEARDDALALLAHDLRSPLAVIVGYVDLMARRAERGSLDPDSVPPALRRIGFAARQMTSLLDDLLADASPDAEMEPIETEPVDLGSWLRSIVEHQEGTISTHAILGHIPDDPFVLDINPAKLERAVHNLVANAVKYSPEGTNVEISLEADAVEARIAVRDEGVGIPADDLPRIFDRFHRGANASGRVSGLGLGLTSALRAVRAHGGEIDVESIEGAGTTFTVRLPRHP